MSDISIRDQASLTGSVEISDDSPLALASLKSLNFSTIPVIGDFGKPIDRFPLDKVELGIGFGNPVNVSKLVDNTAHFGAGASIAGTFSICSPKQKLLFDDEQFAPSIQINSGECWAGLSIAVTLQESAGAKLSGVGVTVSNGTTLSFGTLVHFPQPGVAMPSFKEGLATLLKSYAIPHTPAKIRTTPLGIAYTVETTGVITLGASYSAPLEMNALATLGLPFNFALKIPPPLKARVKGSIALAGSFILRTYLKTSGTLIVALHKQKKTTLTASFTASTGIGVDIDGTDILTKVLDAVVPSADLDNLHLDEKQKADLTKALKSCVDHSISLALNDVCSASNSDEAAVVYEVDLNAPDLSATDTALGAALRGDWSAFDTLPNARQLRNIVRALHARNHKLTINLLGLCNAASVADYLTSTTVVHDEHGQIAILDKASAQTISARTTPYAAKTDRLRTLLAQGFVATVAYGAAAGKIGITSFTVQQSLVEYRAQANCGDLTREILLARAVGLVLGAEWDALLKSGAMFNQSKLYLEASYDAKSVMHLFYQDVDKRTPYSPATLDRIGRETKIALLDPAATNSMQRRMALSSEPIWQAMSDKGDPASFKQIPGVAKLSLTAIGAIAADYLDIRWWSDSIQSLTPKLTAVLNAADQSQSSNPLTDSGFMAAHKNLETALGHLAKTRGAFGDGWGLAVMCRLATSVSPLAQTPSVQIDIGWNQKFEHYKLGATHAVGQTGGI